MKFSIIFFIVILFSCVPAGDFTPFVQSLSVKEAKEILNARRPAELFLVDGRSRQMFSEGHIAGATLIDSRQEDAKEKLGSVLMYRTIMVYCSTFKRSGEIVTKLRDLGYRGTIYTIRGGITAWREVGFEIVSE